jgi:hypothetical protein
MTTAPAHRLRAVLAGVMVLFADVAGAEALPGTLPLRRDAAVVSEGGSWTPAVLLLGLAVAAGGYAVWRRGPGAQSQAVGRRAEAAVARLSSQALTPQASVHAVQWKGEEFLLACTPQQVTLLARRPVDTGEGGTP